MSRTDDAAAAERKPLRVLVADDVAEITELVALWLRAEGHEVHLAHSGVTGRFKVYHFGRFKMYHP